MKNSKEKKNSNKEISGKKKAQRDKMKSATKKAKQTTLKPTAKNAKYVYVRAHYRRMPKQRKCIPSPDDKKCGKRLDKWLRDGSMFDDDAYPGDGTYENDTPPLTGEILQDTPPRMGNSMMNTTNRIHAEKINQDEIVENFAAGNNATIVNIGNLIESNDRMGNSMMNCANQNHANELNDSGISSLCDDVPDGSMFEDGSYPDEVIAGINSPQVTGGILQETHNRMGNSMMNTPNRNHAKESGISLMCDNEESEDEKKNVMIIHQKYNENQKEEATEENKENIKVEFKMEICPEAMCNCADCLYKHWTIESDDD